MPLCIARTWSVKFEGFKCEWKVGSDVVHKIGGEDYIRLQAYDNGLCRLVCEDIVTPMPPKMSLTQTDGYKELLRLRNEKQREELAPTASAPRAASLFKVSAKAGNEPPHKVQRQSRSELEHLRKNAQLISITLPAVGTFAETDITVQRPSHPCDALVVKLNEAVLEHVIAYIRSEGLNTDTVAARRRYGSGPVKGVWPVSGGDKYLVRVAAADGRLRSMLFRSVGDAVRARESADEAAPDGDGPEVAGDEGIGGAHDAADEDLD